MACVIECVDAIGHLCARLGRVRFNSILVPPAQRCTRTPAPPTPTAMSLDTQVALARPAPRGESSHLSRAARQVVPPFLQKLYESVAFHVLPSSSAR